ncbi:hypothetical protein RUM43_004629 [Polyplax serrata]|uniref:PH domain-containing protein n=1 Tax=Polyplax serrata TaxID=468196 RepID=A0AAN8SDB8_POLSC
MSAKKINCIPLCVAIWLQDIRYVTEEYDEFIGKGSSSLDVHSSNDSIYDNVNGSDWDANKGPNNAEEENRFCISVTEVSCDEKSNDQKLKTRYGFSTWPPRRVSTINHSSQERILEHLLGKETGVHLKDAIREEEVKLNWLRDQLKLIGRVMSLSDAIYGKEFAMFAGQEDKKPGSRVAFMSNLLAIYRERHTQESFWSVLNGETKDGKFSSREDLVGDIVRGLKEEITNLGNRMTRICDSLRGNHFVTANDAFKCSELRQSKRSILPNSQTPGEPVISDGGLLATKPPSCPKRKTNNKRKSNQKQTYCPGIPSHGRRKMNFTRGKGIATRTGQWKTKETNSVGNSIRGEKDKHELSPCDFLEAATINDEDDVRDRATSMKPLPFPLLNPELEYEINELLMMQRVTESSKTRRRIQSTPTTSFMDKSNNGVGSSAKGIPKVLLPVHHDNSLMESRMTDWEKIVNEISDDAVDDESKNRVKQFLKDKFEKSANYQEEPKLAVKVRRDIIIDWENTYENEPVVLEGKSVLPRSSRDVHVKNNERGAGRSAETENSTSADRSCRCLKPGPESLTVSDSCTKSDDICLNSALSDEFTEDVPKQTNSGWEISRKTCGGPLSNRLNSFSDVDSEIFETTNCTTSSNENVSAKSVNFDRSPTQTEEDNTNQKVYVSVLQHTFSTSDGTTGGVNSDEELVPSAEGNSIDDSVFVNKRIECTNKRGWKSASENDLLNNFGNRFGFMAKRSRSLYLFPEVPTGVERVKVQKRQLKESIASDVFDWMSGIRGLVFEEDRLHAGDDEWVLSFDSEERAYFFEETSKKSLWALPDYSSDNSKSEFPFSIQRSATESAIGNETGVKLRQSKDGDKISRISGSARSSKTQSMLLEPKYDISANNGNKTYSMPRHLSKVFGEIIHVGVLNKTKILDGGKKLRKNWTPAFVVLNESYLFFFKDAKSFQNMKNVLSPSNNHMCLSLQGAVIEKGDKISSRKNVYKISCSDNTDVLIQTDKTGDAEDWFREINTVIQSLPPDPSTANSSPPSDLSSPSKT